MVTVQHIKLILFGFLLVIQLLEFSLSENITNYNLTNSEILKNINNARIVGGSEALPNQFPYQVLINTFKEDGTTKFCGGALVTHKWIFTAAHCVYGAVIAIVTFGAHDRKNLHESTQKSIIVSRCGLIAHSDFLNAQADIALVKLPEPIPFDYAIQPISLPCSSDAQTNFIGSIVLISGWGRVSDDPDNYSATLRFTYVELVSPEECKYTYGLISTPRLSKIYCARGSSGESSCSGDSGGPVVSLTKDGRINNLIGIVSFGGEKCEIGLPVGFTKVSSHLNWIFLQSNGEINFPQC